MNSRRIPPTLQGQQQQQQQQRNDTSGISAPVPVPAPAPGSTLGVVKTPISPGQVVALVRNAWHKAAGGDDSPATNPDGSMAGITLNLTGKNIPALPDEVIDILRNGVERLSLSHNALSSVPARISQCSSLRYLAARNNAFDEFPLPLCELTSLEFLDLGRNRLRKIPKEIAKLVSLKALALQDNLIESIPLGVASMATLQVLRLTGNPVRFPLREVLQPPAGSLASTDGMSKDESFDVERVVTAQIKNFLSQMLNPRLTETSPRSEGTDDELSSSPETPRVLSRRATGRFPIRVRGSDGSPSQTKQLPPPIPGRSHFRAFSQVSNASSKSGSGMIPLTMGRSREGGPRSTSVPPKVFQQADTRPRSRSSLREASVPPDEDVPPETPVEKPRLNRFSNHFRGVSDSGGLTLTNPFSPEEHSLQRPFFVRELSALPVRRYGFQTRDPVLEVAKGILYSIYQIHLGVQTLMSLTNDGNTKRSSLEMVFYNTNMYFVELEQAIQDFDLSAGTRGARREHDAMQNAYTTLINAYVHICAKLIASVDILVENGDPRYMRTFLMAVYHSIMELRVSLSSWLSSPEGAAMAPSRPPSPEPLTAIASRAPSPEPLTAVTSRPPSRAAMTSRPPSRATSTSRPPSRAAIAAAIANNSSEVPNTARLGFSARRPGKVGLGMQVKTDIPYIERSRRGLATIVVTSGSASRPTTPVSDDSFTSAISSPEAERNPHTQIDLLSSDGDRQFERFFISLKHATDQIMRVLPGLNNLLTSSLQRARSNETAQKWETLKSKTRSVIQQTETLRERLANLQLRDPSIYLQGHGRSPSPFWASCNTLFSTWAELGDQIKLALVEKLVVSFPSEIIDGLRRISRSMKGSIDIMVLVRKQAAVMSKSGGIFPNSPPPSTATGSTTTQTPGQVNMNKSPPLPMTPQSAALGPAFRATKPMPMFGSSP
ncbi:RAM signaling pathway domain containing protein [Rhypophila decipiens]